MFQKIMNYLKEDYERKTYIFASVSTIMAFLFAVYNGVLGVMYSSLWYGSCSAYYILLIIIRLLLLIGERRTRDNPDSKAGNVIVMLTFILLFVINIAMTTPAVMLLLNKRTYNFGMIPAIAMAAYTFYSIVMAIINIIKTKTDYSIFIKLVNLISLIAALMSLLVLQNTLILATDGYNDEMRILTICSTVLILLAVLVLIILSFIHYLQNRKQHKQEALK